MNKLSSLTIAAFLVAFLGSQFLFSQTDKKEEYKVAAIGFYNLENLFDTVDVADKMDEDFTPTGRLAWNSEKYISKEAHMAKVISEMATELNPDGLAILGVAEIENRKVLEDLISQEPLKNRNYQIVHFDSPDERGIDVGLLYSPKYFKVEAARPLFLDLTDPDKGTKDYTRDVLLVSGQFDGEPLHVMVNHWPSRRGGEKNSEWARIAAATLCRKVCDSLLLADPNAKIVVMGDLNDDPVSKSLTKGLRTSSNPKKMEHSAMYNPMYDLYKNGTGTMAYRDAWSLFDQLIVSKGLVSKKVGGWQFYKPVIFNKPWLKQLTGNYQGYPLRTFDGDTFINGYSDHFPVYFFMLKKA